MKYANGILSEYKIIIKSKTFFIFLFLTTLFMVIDSFYLYRSVIPQTIDNRIKLYSESLISLSDWVIIDKEFILNLLRPIHPYTAFLNPIYMFSTISVIVYIVIASILMGTEFKNRTIKARLSISSKLHIFLIKILTVLSICIATTIYTVMLNLILSIMLWPRIENEYGFFLNKFNIDYNISLFASIKEVAIYISMLCAIVIFYTTISMLITYYSSVSTFGMIVCILPFMRFNSVISKIIVAPMDVYYYVLSKFISVHTQGFYTLPQYHLTNSTTNSSIFITGIAIVIIEAMLLFLVSINRKKI